MPGMDGHQALKEIKLRSPDLPVIILTGHGAVPSAREALNEGAFDYLAKPCDMDILAGKITDAYRHGKKSGVREEKCVRDVMLPIGDYTSVRAEQCVGDAVRSLIESFTTMISSSRIIENRPPFHPRGRRGGRGAGNPRDQGYPQGDDAGVPQCSQAHHGGQHPVFSHVLARHVLETGGAGGFHEDRRHHVACSAERRRRCQPDGGGPYDGGQRGSGAHRRGREKKVVGVVREHDLLFAMEGCLGR